MRQITSSHAADIKRVLQGLVAKNALIQEGQARGSRYRLAIERNALSNASSSVHKELSSVHKEFSSVHSDTSSANKSAQENETMMLEKLAKPARGKKRLAPKDMEQVTLERCHGLLNFIIKL